MNQTITPRLLVASLLLFTLMLVRAPDVSAQSAVAVSLPSATGDPGARVTVPITVGSTTGRSIIAYDFTVTFNPSILTLVNVRTPGTLSDGWTITTNAATAGTVRVIGFNAMPLSGSGTLLNLRFDVIGSAGNSTPLTFANFTFNEGDPGVQTSNGSFTVSGGSGVQPGNCNGDSAIDAGDISALVLEIFDGDGSAVGNVGGGTFVGTVGCDANADASIDAADISCTVLLIFNGTATCGSAAGLVE